MIDWKMDGYDPVGGGPSQIIEVKTHLVTL